MLPQAPPGPGLSPEQRARRRVGQALAYAGYVEAPTYPFLSPEIWDQLGADPDDRRRNALRLANPLSDEEPELRTALLPGLLLALRRNERRGMHDVGLFEIGCVYLPRPAAGPVPRPDVTGRPTRRGAGRPRRCAAATSRGTSPSSPPVSGRRPGGGGRADRSPGPTRSRRPAPWRALWVWSSTYAVVHSRRGTPVAAPSWWSAARWSAMPASCGPGQSPQLGLPERTVAMELDLSALLDHGTGELAAPRVSTFPVATQDVALVVADDVPAAEVAQALRDGAGELLESVRLFDVYRGEQLGAGKPRSPTRCGSGLPTARSRSRRCPRSGPAPSRRPARRTGAVLRGA